MKKKSILLIGGPFDGRRMSSEGVYGHTVILRILPAPNELTEISYKLHKYGTNLLGVWSKIELEDASRLMFERYPAEINYDW